MSSSRADLHAGCFDHGRAHVFAGDATPWVGFVAACADQAVEAKQAAYGDAQYFDQLSADHQLEVIEIRAARTKQPGEPAT